MFDPGSIGSESNSELTYAKHKLHRDKLLDFAKRATCIRRAISEQVEKIIGKSYSISERFISNLDFSLSPQESKL